MATSAHASAMPKAFASMEPEPCKEMGCTIVRLKRLFLMAWSRGPPSQYCAHSEPVRQLHSQSHMRQCLHSLLVPVISPQAIACEGLGEKLVSMLSTHGDNH